MENREEMVCPYSKKCGGCSLWEESYSEQLQIKHRQVKKLLKGFGEVPPLIAMRYPYYYRNKVHAVFGMGKRGQILCGVYEKNSHRIVDVESCMIEDKQATSIIRDIKELLPSFKIKPYNEDTGYGLLRHVLVRRAFSTGEVMVVLVLTSPILPSKNSFVKTLLKKHPEITTILLNVNDKDTSMVLGEYEKVLYGKGYIIDELLGAKFRISAKSFYQVNPIQTKHLYRKAIEMAGLTGEERVLDAYCGTGTIGLLAATGAKDVMGVELNSEAVRDAIQNAKQNQVQNIRFLCADATEYMMRAASQEPSFDIVFMDPPRAGSTKEFIRALIQLAPKRVVYISCNPETLARDLKWFKNYQVEQIQPFDMFPFTEHVETVVLLSQQKPDDYIEVELELDELDLTSAESKATYKEIQEYVLKKHGLKVSNLYISQVKRKCGIEVGVNYNLPKSEDSRQPQCPVEKEKAIKDALEHFGMI